MSINGSASVTRRNPLLIARALARDSSGSAWLAGLITVVVGYSGPAVIIISAAQAGHLSAAQSTSWIWSVSVGCGALTIGLSVWTRMPIIIAWSTPGAALLVTGIDRYPYPGVIGAYLVVAVATAILGASGWFGQIMARIPAPLVSAMLAGILFNFGTGGFDSLSRKPIVPATVLIAFLVGKRISARLAVPLALVCGVSAALLTGQVHGRGIELGLARPHWTSPALSVSALIGIGIPLFIVTLTAQNAAGIGVLRSFGYKPDDRKLVTASGLGSLLAAPFGCHALNLAAITAAICAGPSTHRDPTRRYVAGVSAGLFYLVIGSFGATLIAVFAALPTELIASMTCVALLGALLGALTSSLHDERYREPAVITFLASASGLTLLGIGSAFWGLVFGLVAEFALRQTLDR